MDTRLIDAEATEAIEAALQVLRQGGLVAFPTDTVYGVGALVFYESAVQAIYAAKGRAEEKAIPVLIGDISDVDRVALSFPPKARRLAERFWPGPLTLVVRKQESVPSAVSADDTVGVRVPHHRAATALLQAAGPMAVTSANISGEASPCTAEEVMAQLGGRIDLILNGGRTPGGVPSTVVDCTKEGLPILRVGPINPDEIDAALASPQL
jgi:L-threonylcarbamoyladenylate synthase